MYKNYTKQTGVPLGRAAKIWLIMRLTTVILFAGLMQVSAAGLAQKISLQQSGADLKVVLQQIRKQSGFDFVITGNLLKKAVPVSISVKEVQLEKVLDEIFRGQPLQYSIDEKTIVVSLRDVPLPGQSNGRIEEASQRDSILYRGKVLDEKGLPLPGATIFLKGGTHGSVSREDGYFERYGTPKGTMVVRYVGYMTKEITLAGLDPSQLIIVKMSLGVNTLQDVNIVSTGYQDIPKERATGSFEVVTKEELQHSTSPDLVRRLEGLTTSMNFNNQLLATYGASNSFNSLVGLNAKSAVSNLTIRGKNTLLQANTRTNQSGAVLIVIDGIASPYSIDQVNPNDVETITLLKDAAAASIWGSRAANGVIVIKTKRGGFNKPITVSLNSSINIQDKPDLFYRKTMSTSDFIDAQIFQFNASNTTIGPPDLYQGQRVASPVAEILNRQKLGEISSSEATAQINALRENDLRNDLDKYILRTSFSQNHSLGIDGGTKGMAYRLAAAFDKSLNNVVFSDNDRLTLSFNSTFRPFKNLELQANLAYAKARTNDLPPQLAITGYMGGSLYPYTRLADDQGNPLKITYGYRQAFKDLLTTTYGTKLLNMDYKPLDEINQGYLKSSSQNINFNLVSNIRLSPMFSLNAVYNYNQGNNEQNLLYRPDAFFVRDMINRYTAGPNFEDPLFGPQPFRRNIPLGGFFLPTIIKSDNQTLRGMLNANKTWNERHVLSAIAGVDVAQTYAKTRNDRYYGYDEKYYINNNQINYSDFFLTLYGDFNSGPGYSRIPGTAGPPFSDVKVRTYSMFANASYTFDSRYTLSGSVRKDASSEFGSGTNRAGTPYYHVGASWNIVNEKFYNLDWLPRLQLRTTFGYNGNVNAQIVAQPYISYPTTLAPNGLNFGQTSSDFATNSRLRPEKTGVLNFGLDFGLRNNWLAGSIEYYDKKTTDLIASSQVDPSTGFSTLYLNTASLRGRGIDFTLASQNFRSGMFKWTSNFLFSYNRVKVTKVFGTSSISAATAIAGSPNYSEGADLSRLFAFRWAGLDPATGDPRGFDASGQPLSISSSAQGTANYTAITNLPSASARYFGSAVPVYYGSLRNTFNFGNFSLSASLLYKFGYYFRRSTANVVSYSSLVDPISNTVQGIEYGQRWQKPGDERNTNVPSFTYPTSQARDNFYYYSEINVLKGDHVRLQEINISYSFSKQKWLMKNFRVYANVSNLGVLWRANKLGIDPDTYDYPIPRTYSMGINANF